MQCFPAGKNTVALHIFVFREFIWVTPPSYAFDRGSRPQNMESLKSKFLIPENGNLESSHKKREGVVGTSGETRPVPKPVTA